ncbi:hypothetical protein E4T44_03231 [Aureobasidium sp. EXF-8845]|nr:hypothetical protein E4T45_05884 [Aureobasidium sp. EXF-8846]KAI4849626.1 hypothetical protein E4T44_03231 [Aureobasidium sp. EXF-8845]
MSVSIHLGSLRLSCPSTGLDLALTSNASISTLSQSCSFNTPSITDIQSGLVWLAPTTNVKLLLAVIWPSSTSDEQNNAVRRCLLIALRRAALWSQLDLQPSLTIEPSQCPNTCLLVISLTPASSLMAKKKLPIHRLGKDVPYSHLKPPEGLPHWTLDQIHLTFDIKPPFQSSSTDADTMLLESSTLLEDQTNLDPTSSTKINDPERIIGMVDVALRLALTEVPPRAFSGMKITEKSSFKHLDDICPAMWSPNHIEALASRAVFLPTISHAISNSISQRAHSFSLKEKLKEIARQESTTARNMSHTEPQTIQRAVSIRLWRLMQRRLHDRSAGKRLSSIRASDATLSTLEQDEDVDNELSFEYDEQRPVFSQSEVCFGLGEEADEADLLDIEYDSEWEDLFTDLEVVTCLSDDDEMLDRVYEGVHEDEDENLFSGGLEDDITSALEDMLEL